MLGGYLGWTKKTLNFLDLNGYVLREPVVSAAFAWGPSGIQIPMLSGGAVYQRIPQGAHAPINLGPLSITLNFMISGYEEYFRIKRIGAIAREQPVYMFCEYLMEEVWPIRGDAWTDWVLSRQTPYGMYSYATYTPECYVQDASGNQSVVSFSTSTSSNDTVVTTGSLAAYAGQFLVFRYYPLLLVMLNSISESIPEPNGMDISVNLLEHIPIRTYG